MPRHGSDHDEAVADLWAMAAELERQFAGYKQRLAQRDGTAADDDASGGGEVEPPGGADGGGGGDVRGRMYKAYVRRRDERLRQGWRARMERKEAEVKAFWAQLELTGGRAGGNTGGGGPTTTDDDAATSAAGGSEEGKTERNHDDKKRSSDAALAPRRISGKKHARTRSFSSSTNKARNHSDVGRRRALSQELPPSSEPQISGDASKESRARRPAGCTAATTTTSRPKTSLRRKNSVKGLGSAKQTGPNKLPRSLPRRASSGGLELLSKEAVVLPSADAAVPLPRRSYEQDVHGETPKASPPINRLSTSVGVGAGEGNAQTASPDSDWSEVVDVEPEGKPEADNADMKKHGDEVDASPGKLGNPNGDITSDSNIEQNHLYDNRDIVKEEAMSLPETRSASEAVPDFSVETNQDTAETTTAPPAGATGTTGVATTNAEEAPERESSGDSSFSGRLGRTSSPGSAKPSCSSRDQSIERVLEADAALLRKKRAEKSALRTPPGSAGSRASGTARSPKETPRGFKRFLSFGKKNRAREVTVIDCTSPSLSSAADDDSGRWQSAGSIKPRMRSSNAASDDTDHGHTTSPRVSAACSLQSLVAASPAKSELAEIAPRVKSPKAHRSLFSFRSLNCGRG